MAKFRGAVVVDTDRCKGCGLCVEACPQNVLALSSEVNAKSYHYAEMAEPEKCVGCSACGYVCPDAVLTIYRVKN